MIKNWPSIILIFIIGVSSNYLSSNNIASLSSEEENIYTSILDNWKSYSKDKDNHQWKWGMSWEEGEVLYKKRAYLKNELRYIGAKSFMEYINLSYLLFLYPALLVGNYDVLRIYAGIYGLAFLSDIGIKIKKDSDYKKKLRNELIVIDQILARVPQLESGVSD